MNDPFEWLDGPRNPKRSMFKRVAHYFNGVWLNRKQSVVVLLFWISFAIAMNLQAYEIATIFAVGVGVIVALAQRGVE